MFKVIEFFTDLQDGEYAYEVGDEYPREGLEVTEERINELMGDSNRRGIPLIEEVEEPKVEEPEEAKPKRKPKKSKEE